MSLPYIQCPSCGSIIGPIIDKYLTAIKKINSDGGLSEDEKQIKKTEFFNKLIKPKNKYCCNIRIMGSCYYTELIK